MKKISILAALALGAALIFSGCDTDAVTEAISELTDSTTEDTTTDDDTTTGDEAADEDADEEEESAAIQYDLADIATIALEKNGTYNNQAVIEWLADSNTTVLATGDTVKFTITATADSSAGELKGYLVDNSEAGGWWTLLTDYVTSSTEIATDETTYTFEFTLTADASSEDPAACKLGLYFEPVQDDTVTLTVSSFTVE